MFTSTYRRYSLRGRTADIFGTCHLSRHLKEKSRDTVLKVNRKLNSIKAQVERYFKVNQMKITTDQRQVSVKQI